MWILFTKRNSALLLINQEEFYVAVSPNFYEVEGNWYRYQTLSMWIHPLWWYHGGSRVTYESLVVQRSWKRTHNRLFFCLLLHVFKKVKTSWKYSPLSQLRIDESENKLNCVISHFRLLQQSNIYQNNCLLLTFVHKS